MPGGVRTCGCSRWANWCPHGDAASGKAKHPPHSNWIPANLDPAPGDTASLARVKDSVDDREVEILSRAGYGSAPPHDEAFPPEPPPPPVVVKAYACECGRAFSRAAYRGSHWRTCPKRPPGRIPKKTMGSTGHGSTRDELGNTQG